MRFPVHPIGIPEAFARGTIAREGERGARWLATLPELIAELVERWDCVEDGPVMHGEVGIIVPVRKAGRRAVLKISFPHPGNVSEPFALAAWGGDGAVRLYEHADESFAMLLERADTHTLAEVGDTDEMVRVAGRINHRLAVPGKPWPALPRLRDRAPEWEQSLRQEAATFRGELPPRVVDAALDTVREFGFGQPELVLHGDLHPRNILRAEREPWLAVDPKGYVGDPAYDGGTLVKSLLLFLLAQDDPDKAVLRSLAGFAEAAELDPERVRRWAQFHGVQTAFWVRHHFSPHAAKVGGLDKLTPLADHFAALLA
jgi:streptomycin 6-kinase